MRTVSLNFCVAKIQPKYWNAIKNSQKTVEIRDERVDADYFIFIDDKYNQLGTAQITGCKKLEICTDDLPEEADVTMNELEHIYPNHVKDGIFIKPLYAYYIQRVTPCDIA